MNLKVFEIFSDIQGESSYSGYPCTFIRLSECNLRCTYCDTQEAYTEGKNLSVKNILIQVEKMGCQLVEITGGEPMLQKGTPELAGKLISKGYTVLVETNGTVDIRSLKDKIITIFDIKCPGSGMTDKICWKNLQYLKPHDEIKFVIGSKSDYDWAKSIVVKHNLDKKHIVHFSPVWSLLKISDLASWVFKDNLYVRVQPQLHKLLGRK
jgi:7-carboxy-7-deazaguanine synthase